MTKFQILYQDSQLVVCIKPPGIRSTDEPGGLPDLCREVLGDPNVRTVHRLDQAVSGLMVLARTRRAASDLSAQIREGTFHKEYHAVLQGIPCEQNGTLVDLLFRDKQERKTYVVSKPGKDVQEAILKYETMARSDTLTRVRIELITGRTHQIRCQFSSRGLPLLGDKKYSTNAEDCSIALWSAKLRFRQPKTGEELTFSAPPPNEYPWNQFK